MEATGLDPGMGKSRPKGGGALSGRGWFASRGVKRSWVNPPLRRRGGKQQDHFERAVEESAEKESSGIESIVGKSHSL